MFWVRSDPNVIRSEKVPSGPDTAIQTVPTGLVGRAARRPCDAGRGDAVHGACRPADALGHLLGDGTADGSEALQIAPVYAEQRALHVVRVCYHAAPKVVRGAG